MKKNVTELVRAFSHTLYQSRSLLSIAVAKGSNASDLLTNTYETRIKWLKAGQPNAEDWVIDMIQVNNEYLHRHGSK